MHSGIWEDSILLTVGQPASYDAGIRGKPLGGFPPNPLSLVLTDGGSGEPPSGSNPKFYVLNSTMLPSLCYRVRHGSRVGCFL